MSSQRTGLNGFMDKLTGDNKPQYCIDCHSKLEYWGSPALFYCANKECYRFGLIAVVRSLRSKNIKPDAVK